MHHAMPAGMLTVKYTSLCAPRQLSRWPSRRAPSRWQRSHTASSSSYDRRTPSARAGPPSIIRADACRLHAAIVVQYSEPVHRDVRPFFPSRVLAFSSRLLQLPTVAYRAKTYVTGRSVRALVTLGRCLPKRAAVDVRSTTHVQRSFERSPERMGRPMSQRRSPAVRRRATARRSLKTVATRPAGAWQQLPDAACPGRRRHGCRPGRGGRPRSAVAER